MVKRFFLRPGFMLIAVICLGACTPSPLEPVQAITAAMTDTGFRPGKWWVPAGKTITLNLSNQGSVIHDWTLLARPLTDPFDQNDSDHILFKSALLPGESTTITFQAPAMPGEYDLISTQPGDIQAGLMARLITVQP